MDHVTDHGPLDHGFAGLDQELIVAHQPTKLVQPGKSTLDYPTLRMHRKAHLIGRLFHDLEHPIGDIGDQIHQKTPINAVGIQALQAVIMGFKLRQYRQGTLAILDVGGSHFQTPDQPESVYGEMTFASFDLLVAVITDARLLRWPPFSVVFTDWLSRMATEGEGALPIWMRI
jgi:hypothetical protein